MKNLVYLCLLSFINLFAYGQYMLEENYLEITPKQKASECFQFENLGIYPIYAGSAFKDANKDVGKYQNLKKALEKKMIIINEVGSSVTAPAQNAVNVRNAVNNGNRDFQNIDNSNIGNNIVNNNVGNRVSGQVNQLLISNVSQDTIYLMAGEIVKGGKQDRVLASDMVLPPGAKDVDISVFCVEHGRWKTRKDGNYTFSNHSGTVSNSIRKAAVKEKNQSSVWQKVAEITNKNDAGTETQTYTAMENAVEFNKKQAAYFKFFKEAILSEENIIGFIGVTGDKVIGMDLFANNHLFLDQLDNLVNSYSTEAISNGSKVKLSYEEVVNYANIYLSDENEQEQAVSENGSSYKSNGKKLHINTF